METQATASRSSLLIGIDSLVPGWDWLGRHPAVACLLASGGFFYGGYRSFTKGEYTIALQWQAVAVALLAIFIGSAIYSGMLVGLAPAGVALGAEIWFIVRSYTRKATSARK